MEGKMIEIVNLTKKFEKFLVFEDVNVVIESNKITAIVGPNGSGKSTLIKSMLGLVKPTSGKILIDGVDITKGVEYKKYIGYMSQNGQFPNNLTPEDLLNMLVSLRNVPADALDIELLDLFKLESYMNKPIETLSGGTKQKVNAFLAFLFNPPILILDEPTVELDPMSSNRLKQKIFKERERGKTILMASHIMSEVEEMADYIVFLLDKKIYVKGLVDEVKSLNNSSSLEEALAKLMEEAYNG